MNEWCIPKGGASVYITCPAENSNFGPNFVFVLINPLNMYKLII